MSPDVHTLTGAYAMDALDEFERRQFESHLAGCEDCAREVRELRATSARLALAVAEEPSDAVRRRVFAEISRTRQESPVGGWHRGGSRWRDKPWALRLTTAAAVVALAGAVAAGTVAVRAGHQATTAQAELSQSQARFQPIDQILAAPDARVGTASSVSGGRGLLMTSADLNRAVLVVSGMPPAPSGHAYQAWVLSAGKARSVGLLSTDPDKTIAPLALTAINGKSLVGITVEPAGGSKQPTTNPVMLVGLPA